MSENLSIQYVTDQEGNKEAVLIPIKEWNKILQELQEMREFQSFKTKLNSGFDRWRKSKLENFLKLASLVS